MAAQLGRDDVHDLTPEEVARGLAEGHILLVDVREPNEIEVERYPDAVVRAAVGSSIRPRSPIRRAGRWCSPAAPATARSPLRSRRRTPGLPYDAHLAGGIKAWKELGLPTETVIGPCA